jgi:sugar lactone lactonase YvrE
MKNLLVRAAQVTAIALPLALPTLAAANPVGTLGLTVGSRASQIAGSSLNTRQRLMLVSGHSAAATTPGAKSSWIDPRYAATIAAGTTPLVYASITGSNKVLAYATNAAPAPPTAPPAPVETITGLAEPAGLAVDSTGNLYVIERVTNDVKVFKPGQMTPFETLLPPTGSAFLSVAVDARGTVYAGTTSVSAGTPNGSISVYSKGATTPSNTVSDPAIQSANGIAVDGIGNVFLNYVGPVASNTLGYAVGALPVTTSIGETFFHRLAIDSASNSPQPLGLTLDKNGDLVIADTMGVVSIYRPATNTPVVSFQATGLIGNVFNINLALTGPTDRHLLVAPHDTSVIYQYAYPSGTLETTILLPAPTVVEGLATSPASPRGVW